jgi:thiosulfate dehydrogenase
MRIPRPSRAGRRTPVNALLALAVAAMAGSTGAADAPPVRPSVPLAPPAAATMPAGALGDAIRYGERIVNDTQATVKAFVGNGLTCANCHLDGGRTAFAAPFVGLTGLFPEYRTRSGRVESLEDRINDCFVRSMNGRKIPPSSPAMIGLLAYIAWLSQGVPTGTAVEGRGFLDISATSAPDPRRGKALYAQRCAACHGANGQGTAGANGSFAFPPLWGVQSFNAGAGMARVGIAAAFVRAKMPLGAAGTLSDQEAFDVAAYFTAQPRPAFAAGNSDWPRGDRPADAPTGGSPR